MFRWYIEERKWSTWDSRWDVWNHHSVQSKPILQYKENDKWITIPTEISVVDERINTESTIPTI